MLLAWLAFFSTAFGQPFYTIPTGKDAIRADYVETAQSVKPASAQMPRNRGTGEDRVGIDVRTELPGPQRLFSRESEEAFFDRIAQEMRKHPGASRAIFPESSIISHEPYKRREFPEMIEVVEPSYVCHRRLYFEQPNFERAGYNFGILQPALCLGVFYYDTLLLPYHAWTDLRDRGECSAGKCLPGDQSPFLIPRERFSVTGAVGQAGTVFGLLYLFP